MKRPAALICAAGCFVSDTRSNHPSGLCHDPVSTVRAGLRSFAQHGILRRAIRGNGWSIVRFLERYEVFIVLAGIILANVVFVAMAASGYVTGGLYNYGRFFLLGATLLVVILMVRGSSGLSDIVKPFLNWRVKPKWYLFALLWPPVIAMGVLLAKVLLTDFKLADLTFGTQFLTRFDILANVAVGAFIGEIVWVSYAIRQLSKFASVFLAAVFVGIVWTLWWMPMAYFNFGIVPGLEPQTLLMNQTGVALFCGLVYYHTRSALCVLILQLNVNLSLLVFPVLPTTGGEGTYTAFAAAYLICAILGFVILGPKPLFARTAETDDFAYPH